ncbi:Gas vesicle synthesis protein GvpO [Micromonospora pattaloongensis]|uniref:Gas vesicle synthesis protein GvpO n=1 Tax=Micromonospora pattaloongensis TaxID=405436 RepID=A0A1H3Q9B5_9ACTN|nr:gas vesicle protein [Micromonospora pattaloongensis]SDZ09996.1 Gas vesicle synthesis protein GvpO [Micromonospora pattaloongensis]
MPSDDHDADGRDRPRRRRAGTYDEDERPAPRRPLSASVAARAGLQHIAELSGKTPTGVTSIERSEDGWVIGIEVIEDRRIPSSTDILGVYQVEVDMDGELVTYRRIRRYPRGQSDRG